MSYIRSTSNPEELYIYSSGKYVHITHNVNKPFSSGKKSPQEDDMTIPTYIFENALRKYKRRYRVLPISYRDLKIEEVHLYKDNGKKVPVNLTVKKYFEASEKRGGTLFQIKISYKNKFVCMYKTTWDYIAIMFEGE